MRLDHTRCCPNNGVKTSVVLLQHQSRSHLNALTHVGPVKDPHLPLPSAEMDQCSAPMASNVNQANQSRLCNLSHNFASSRYHTLVQCRSKLSGRMHRSSKQRIPFSPTSAFDSSITDHPCPIMQRINRSIVQAETSGDSPIHAKTPALHHIQALAMLAVPQATRN